MIEQRFSGPEIENNPEFADWTHPVDLIDPEAGEETNESDRVLIVRGLMEVIFRRPRLSSALPLDSAWRKFVALGYVLRPELCGGESQTALASRLGVTKAAFSRLCVWWSEQLGVTHPGMKTREAREIYSRIQLGHPSYKTKGGQALPLPIGQTKRRPQDLAVEERRLAGLRQDFLEARTWRKLDKELLRRCGLIDEDGVLTTAGREWVETDPHPSN